jgi:capsid assembly protein Gp20
MPPTKKTKPTTSSKKKAVIKEKAVSPKPVLAEKVLSHLANTYAVNGDLSSLEQLRESMKVFGFAIGDPKEKVKQKNPSFALPESDDGAVTTTVGGAYGSYINIEGYAKNEIELITRYREMAIQPECDYAIQDIVNESIVNEDNNLPPVTLETDSLTEYSDNFKEQLVNEFNTVVRLLNFKRKGQQIFKRWYIDARLFYHIMIDEANPRNGIQELRYIDPRRIRKYRELRAKRIEGGAEVFDVVSEYYIYNIQGVQAHDAVTGIKISPDSIAHCHSGLVDIQKNLVLSYLHKAIKPLNQLRYIEDATVIYRISRAPERRIFYIDVGSMPAQKAQQYLNDVMNRYRNKLVYDANTGEVRDDKKFLSMQEDYWIPRREGEKGTQVDTLKGGENLGKLDDVIYFEKKLYKALNVPISRLESENGGLNMGRSSEISRDEEKFYKFIVSLREQFQELFLTLLRTQLLLKGIITESDWPTIQEGCYIDFAKNSSYMEASKNESILGKLSALEAVQPFLGSMFSYEWAYKNILNFSDNDIKLMQKQLAKEKARPSYDQEIEVDLQKDLQKATSKMQIDGQLKLQQQELAMQKTVQPEV